MSSQNQAVPPKHVEVLIVGGGPAGSYAASVLSREGIDVTVLESAKFPRYHIGESLIPSVRPYLKFIGAEEKMMNYGFMKKPGSAIKFNQFKREGYTDFVALGANNSAWNVIRSEFDQLLLNHAEQCGAKVYEQTKVTSIEFDPVDLDKPISASWTRTDHTATKIKGSTSFSYLIDASGRAGLLSTKYLKNRHFNASLKNIAVWGYWLNDGGVGTYGKGTSREGAPWFEALIDESGWAWFIPLHNGKTSVGIVMNQEQYNAQCKSHSSSSGAQAKTESSSLVQRYLANLRLAPGLIRLLSGKDLGGVSEDGEPTSEEEEVIDMPLSATLEPDSVRSASDFSYSAPVYAGGGYRIIGDAGAFIDPFFSSGIHLAFTGALSAAATICASLRKNCTEAEAVAWHTKRVAISYTRFQVVVLSAYKQMRSQNVDVLSDVDEDNFDRAFTFLRPVIQGASDMGSRLSESELQRSLDFCTNLFNPTSPEEHETVRGQLGEDRGRTLMDVTQPVVDPKTLDEVLSIGTGTVKSTRTGNEEEGSEELEAGEGYEASEEQSKMVLNKINARRLVHPEYAINNLEAEELVGYVVRLEKGRLGLVRAQS
ncbi:hypothetical protein GYMLUDRAFT_43286 [Collybiopsis luxurians FD-317 M1]|uniref:FAD-binding domain-containing protein n=1 Tax=Collybiopsis luxurians FD-317 M1 TaxID=944289 RepID=A0A0D0BZ99_9AGAR|nr:hypothetical protein GYMLUDRAFT_43286 [Collybiopsis luxurians FD-317 M1]